jgi:hypothetical protein
MGYGVQGTMNDMYKDNMFYEVSVTDQLSPEAKTFVVGINGKLSSYPTRTRIRISGRELKVLMDAQIPDEQVAMENGFRRVVGVKYIDRFAINIKALGAFPSAKATILQPFGVKTVHLDAPRSLEATPEVASPEDIVGSMQEPEPESAEHEIDHVLEVRREELESEQRDVLKAHAEGLGINVTPRMNKAVIVDAILKAESTGVGPEE